jgi:hypothetical protein
VIAVPGTTDDIIKNGKTMKDVAYLARELTGETSEEKAVTVLLKDYITKKIAECEKEIRTFEKRYGMCFADFERKIGEEFELSWEHEKDYLEWEGAITESEALNERLKLIGV